jgi:ectoine hydroxylase-related dioxygenase (phytanoyl-CoA dioxygenase family)
VKDEDSTFRTDGKQVKAQGSSEYFMDSSDRIHFFNEAGALNENDGNADENAEKAEKPKRLQPQYYKNGAAKAMALNKVGHGLHVEDEIFREYCLSEKIYAVTQILGWKTPVVPQSMYIFKQPVLESPGEATDSVYSNPRAGSEVSAHQDSTFLYTEPRQSCLGLWLALQAATLMNGCLWVRPKSHFEGLSRAFRRNELYFQGPEFRKAKEEVAKKERENAEKKEKEKEKEKEEDKDAKKDKEDDSDEVPSQMIFDTLTPGKTVSTPWEGKLPEGCWPPPCDGMFEAGYIPVEVNAGDLVVFCGTTDHLSLPNYTRESR